MSSAAYVLAAAAAIHDDDLLWTPADVRKHLELLADQLDPAGIDDQALERARIPLVPGQLAEAIGRLLFRGEGATSDYVRCVQVSQLLGDAANRLDLRGDLARGDLLREYAHAVSIAGNAL